MKREIIFEIPNQSEYRVVCRFGYDSIIGTAWWGHVQRKTRYKKYILFGEYKWMWIEVDKGWWNKSFETIEELRTAALELFDDKVMLEQRLKEKAMNLK